MNNITTNGTKPPTPTPNLPSFRTQAMNAFIESQQTREHELDTAYRDLADARVLIRSLETELEGVRSNLTQVESRMTTAIAERDLAKDQQVSLATILNSIQHLLVQAGVPTLAAQAAVQAETTEG
jgi:exonuclease VII small subunit